MAPQGPYDPHRGAPQGGPYDQPPAGGPYDPHQPPPAHYEQQPPQPQGGFGGGQGFAPAPPYEATFDPPAPQPIPFDQPQGPPLNQPYQGFAPQEPAPRVGPPMAPRPAREETLLPPEGSRNPSVASESTASMCPYCEAVLVNPAAAQCDNCLRPLGRQQPPPPPPPVPQGPLTLRLQFPTGELQLQPGQHLVLGRDAGQSPVASTFTQYDNVSRRHTTVWLDQSGTAWCRDERSTNGTFVNGERLPAGVEAPLRDGDTLRLAADVTGNVRLG